ncbi:MAG TPA: DinB family protein [Bryobacteraceae bacterium]|nr:DinB family protein [Bryobacteraceae bacterium]
MLSKSTTLLLLVAVPAILSADGPSKRALEFAQRWTKTEKLAVGVSEAMPAGEYAFQPDPPSMTFGEQMAHIAQTNYQFCAGLKDSQPPPMPKATDKTALVKFLTGSFDYCTQIISSLTDAQLDAAHDSPDGRMPGREILLALYVHMAHHRGQAEIYLRTKGIEPPQYVF